MRCPRCLCCAVTAACAIAAWSAVADDLIAPPWRADDGTTYQQWTFDDDDDPAAPEVLINPYGTASADLEVHPGGGGWYASLLGRDGIWGDIDSVTIEIDNRSPPVDRKQIWIQVTYYLAISDTPIVDIPEATCLGSELTPLEIFAPGQWYLQQTRWMITPASDHDIINITTGPMAMTIDQIVVDTNAVICNDPFADADEDSDVDQEDLGLWQACFTGQAGGVPPGCECFDRDNGGTGDGDVDLDDLTAFEACASAPAVSASVTCDD